MKTERHGLSIGIDRVNDDVFLSLKAIGKLRHEDYELINPLIDSALEGVRHPHVNVFFDASELDGWELRAAWDDFRLGLKHGNEFARIALLGNKRWLELGSKVAGWFTSGEVRYFEDAEQAMQWLQS